MSVNTKQVKRRAGVHYESLDQMLADAERLFANHASTLGNWSAGQIFSHLAGTMNSSIDGFKFSMGAPLRLILNLFMKRKFLTKGLPAGFKGNQSSLPAEIPDEEGLNRLRTAVKRQKDESNRAPHPGFGKLTREEWEAFHLRHAELHMSFLTTDAEG